MKLEDVARAEHLASQLRAIRRCQDAASSSAGNWELTEAAANRALAIDGVDLTDISVAVSDALVALLDAKTSAIYEQLVALGVDTTPSAA